MKRSRLLIVLKVSKDSIFGRVETSPRWVVKDTQDGSEGSLRIGHGCLLLTT